MTRNAAGSSADWDDDDLPEWTGAQIKRAELAIGGTIVRPAKGTLTRAGRPPQGAATKAQVTLRLDPDVIAKFREGGPGWQSRMNAALRKAAGL